MPKQVASKGEILQGEMQSVRLALEELYVHAAWATLCS